MHGLTTSCRYLYMLAALLFFLVASPLLAQVVAVSLLLDIGLTAVLLTGIYVISGNPRFAVVGVALALPMFATTWAPTLAASPAVVVVSDCCGAVLLGMLCAVILRHVFTARKVSFDIVLGSFVGYLLAALAWAFAYKIIAGFDAGAFAFPDAMPDDRRFIFSYFSFVTITTLGYGDITPLSGPARAFAMGEAIVGQMYLVVLVSRLVGLHTAQAARSDDSAP